MDRTVFDDSTLDPIFVKIRFKLNAKTSNKKYIYCLCHLLPQLAGLLKKYRQQYLQYSHKLAGSELISTNSLEQQELNHSNVWSPITKP